MPMRMTSGGNGSHLSDNDVLTFEANSRKQGL